MSRIYHRAKLIDPRGKVSPLCARVPRAINLKRATWTNLDEAVTCAKCLIEIARNQVKSLGKTWKST